MAGRLRMRTGGSIPDPTNERYLLRLAKGIDCKGRDMRSHRGPGQGYLATAEGGQKR